MGAQRLCGCFGGWEGGRAGAEGVAGVGGDRHSGATVLWGGTQGTAVKAGGVGGRAIENRDTPGQRGKGEERHWPVRHNSPGQARA